MDRAAPWSAEEDAILRRMKEGGLPMETIALALGRSQQSCWSHWRVMTGSRKSRAKPWTKEEDERLKSLMAQGLSWYDAAKRMPGRTFRACVLRGHAIGAKQAPLPPSRPDAVSLRRCHDCGRPTTDYRCPRCLAAWKSKNGVSSTAHEDDGYAVGDGWFFCS